MLLISDPRSACCTCGYSRVLGGMVWESYDVYKECVLDQPRTRFLYHFLGCLSLSGHLGYLPHCAVRIGDVSIYLHQICRKEEQLKSTGGLSTCVMVTVDSYNNTQLNPKPI